MSAEAWAAIVVGVFNLIGLAIIAVGLHIGNKRAAREWDKAMGRGPKEGDKPNRWWQFW